MYTIAAAWDAAVRHCRARARLQHEHAERVAENARRLAAACDHLLDVAHALLAVRREAQLLLVTPEHRRTGAHRRLGEHVVQINYLLACVVANQHEHRAVTKQHAVLHQRAHTRVDCEHT
eukprot:2456790-Pleurochrysis_carterae.AAC.6